MVDNIFVGQSIHRQLALKLLLFLATTTNVKLRGVTQRKVRIFYSDTHITPCQDVCVTYWSIISFLSHSINGRKREAVIWRRRKLHKWEASKFVLFIKCSQDDLIKEGETKVKSKKLKGRDLLENLGVDFRIVLKLILKK